MEWIQENWAMFVALMERHPWALGVAIVVLGGAGVPGAPMLLLCGVVWGKFFPMPIVYLLGVLCHYLSAIWPWLILRRVPAAWVGKLPGVNLDSWRRRFNSNTSRLWTTLIVLRMTPGIPFLVQNAIPGVLNAGVLPYLVTSLLGCAFIGGSFIVLGDAVESRNPWMIGGAVIIVVAVGVVSRMIAARTDTGITDDEHAKRLPEPVTGDDEGGAKS